ncbi:DUF3168 domain-containing protein [Aureimonas frigidaquae]|uniref:DUF3168 domain-containing protein n=1 Tax=Aureimonas frigidaquae TaxID=424757 RepID=UPI0009FA8C1E|nr:DUF3168 domain-containing protein [Aureimonas frigidaquae]
MAEDRGNFETAIASALSADARAALLVNGRRFARDRVPGDAPRLTLGHTQVVDWARGSADGSEHVLTLHVHGAGGSKAATFEVMDRVSALLDDALLPFDNGNLLRLKLQFAKARQEPDATDYHGILRFSATRQPLA